MSKFIDLGSFINVESITHITRDKVLGCTNVHFLDGKSISIDTESREEKALIKVLGAMSIEAIMDEAPTTYSSNRMY